MFFGRTPRHISQTGAGLLLLRMFFISSINQIVFDCWQQIDCYSMRWMDENPPTPVCTLILYMPFEK